MKVHRCCTPVNKTMPEILNCCQYFLSNACKSTYFYSFVPGSACTATRLFYEYFQITVRGLLSGLLGGKISLHCVNDY